MKFLRYLKHRLNEKSTYAGLITAISGAALLPSPWSFLAVAVGAISVLVPSGEGE